MAKRAAEDAARASLELPPSDSPLRSPRPQMSQPRTWTISASTISLHTEIFLAPSTRANEAAGSTACLFWLRESIYQWAQHEGLTVREKMLSRDSTRLVMNTPLAETAGYLYVQIHRRDNAFELEVKHRTTFAAPEKQRASAQYVEANYDLPRLRSLVKLGIDECHDSALRHHGQE